MTMTMRPDRSLREPLFLVCFFLFFLAFIHVALFVSPILWITGLELWGIDTNNTDQGYIPLHLSPWTRTL